MSQLRSETMQLYQVTVKRDQDWDTINQLFKLDFIHYIDINAHQQSHLLLYAEQMRRIDDTQKRIQYCEEIFKDYSVDMPMPESLKELEQVLAQYEASKKTISSKLFPIMEEEMAKQENFLRNQKRMIDHSLREFRSLVSQVNVLNSVARVMGVAPQKQVTSDNELQKSHEQKGAQIKESLISQDLLENTNICYFGGVLAQQDINSLKRLLFRATRGRAVMTQFELEVDEQDVIRNDEFHKRLQGYIVLVEDNGPFRQVVERVCKSFNSTSDEKLVFECNPKTVAQDLRAVQNEKAKLRDLIAHSKQTFYNYMNEFTFEHYSLLKVYKQFTNREKAIYKALNMQKVCDSISIGLVWVPTYREKEWLLHIQEMNTVSQLNIHVQTRKVDDELTRPTMFRETEFSGVFQQIVDTYGVPDYKEANPAVFACVTFPFLFGVMFGDVMHGGLLLGFALYIMYAGKEGGKDLFSQLYPIRHFLFLMGFFATFCGFCYNDYTSVPLYLFGPSCYVFHEGQSEAELKPDCVYPVGVDPSWMMSTQELTFMNSLKMKMAVIFGVAQMSLGICMKGSNALYRRSMLDFVFEFLPQIIILIAMFGYMDLMIVIKWLTDWEGRTAYAPSVIGTMIDMFLNLGQPTLPTDAPLFATWAEQTHIELTLLMIVAICVPAMLFVKPIVLSLTAPKSHKPAVVAPAAAELAAINDKDDDFKPIEGTPTPAGDATSPDAGKPTPMAQAAVNPDDKYDLRANIVASFSDGVVHPHDFGELMIHQLIETIEFVLGTVSNTASYLRLWALSLAHSQLAKVFFDNCLIGGFQSGSVISLYLGFFVFMGATIFVLMMMDLLECTLHTLRLHWVEFQNKFFKGQGIAFAPVRIEQTVREN